MKEIITICFLTLFLVLDLSLLILLRRKMKLGGKLEGAVGFLCFTGIGAVAVWSGGIGSERLYQSMQKTAIFSYWKRNFLSEGNPQVLYFLLYLLLLNFAVIAAGQFLWWAIEQLGKIFVTKRRKAWLSGEFLSVLGKWLWNLSTAFLVLFFVQTVCGMLAIYIKIPGFLYERKQAWLYGFFRIPSLLSVIAASAATTLRYDPKNAFESRLLSENVQTEKKKEKNADRASYQALWYGHSMRVPKGKELTTFLPDYLYDCFQSRRRVLVLCNKKEEVESWRATLKNMLSGRFGEICLIRIGDAASIRNREDVDLLVVDASTFQNEKLQQVWSFWFSQVGLVILSDSHRFLSRTTQADWFFSLWNPLVQYLFLDCTMTAQEKEAFDYYAGSRVEDANQSKDESSNQSQELVPWMLVSPAGRYRRLLLLMSAGNGISESVLDKQKKRFGCEQATTEDFLANVLSTVLPEYTVQNSYDAFTFHEEIGWPHSKWYVRISDSVAESLSKKFDLSKEETGQIAFPYQFEKTTHPDLVYEFEGMTPLSSVVYQKNKTFQLCQTQISCTHNGVYVFSQTKGANQYTQIGYEQYEEKTKERHTSHHEGVCLILTILGIESSEKRLLEKLLCAVCNEVFETVFPYNQGQLIACYKENRNDGEKSFVPTIQENKEFKKNLEETSIHPNLLTIYLVENQSEQGLATAIYQNSSLFLKLCVEWLSRAINDATSKEAALVEYLMKEQTSANHLMLPAVSTSAGQLAGLAKLLKGILWDKN